MHTIIHFAADTITYDEPTIPLEPNKTQTEPLAIHIWCIHHQNNNIGTINQINTINTIIENLQISQYHTQTTPPTPPYTKVNKNTKWNKLIYPPYNNPQNIDIISLPNFEINTILKFLPQYSYYTDGSFVPPKEADDGHWKKEKAGYGIYNPSKPDVQISKRLPGLQTCFRAELMAIHETLSLITTKYINEPAHIFTDCLNCIHVLNTQLKYPTQQNNHADKTILKEMVEMLKKRTQPTTIYKVKAHAKINGNEHADQLAKEGTMKRNYQFAANPHEFAHTTPYYFQKDTWPGRNKRPDKGPVRCLEEYIKKYDRKNNLEILAEDFPNINKWTTNSIIDNEMSNDFWNNLEITDSQKTSILKFRTGQYMGNAKKQLIFGIQRFP